MTILKDISLCAIVRDEKMNPAGGIARFIDSHVPYVEQAVIADTGSVDGTREILEEAQSKYSNLKVIDVSFRGYSDARNRAMENVQTKRVLVLDADELLTHKKPQDDWKILKNFIEENPSEVYEIDSVAIPPSGIDYIFFDTFTSRLFNLHSHVFFKRVLWEDLLSSIAPARIHDVLIKHFVPSQKALDIKKANWYLTDKQTLSEREYIRHFETPPSQIDGFAEWKEFNPLRDDYI